VDKEGILERILDEPDYYPTAVGILSQGLPYFTELEDIYFHIFELLVRQKLL